MINLCYANHPQNEEEAVQTGLQKWLDGGGDRCTWKHILDAMRIADIGAYYCKMLREELHRRIKGMEICFEL